MTSTSAAGQPDRRRSPRPSDHRAIEHASAEEYEHFIGEGRLDGSKNWRITLRQTRQRFVEHYPDLGRWTRRPLAERLGPVGLTIWPPTEGLVDTHGARASLDARPYLLYLSLTGRLPLDWAWLFGASNLRWLAIADGLGLPLRAQLEQLHGQLTALGSADYTANSRLLWSLPRLLLHRADPALENLTSDDVEELRAAIRGVHELPGADQLRLPNTSRDGCPADWLGHATQTGVALFHAGFIDQLPRRTHSYPKRTISEVTGVAATIERYLAEIALTRRPGTVVQKRSALLRLADWHRQTRPDEPDLSQLDRPALLEFLAWLPHQRKWKHPDQPLSAVYRHHVTRNVVGFFSHGAARGWPDMPARAPLTSADAPREIERVPRFIPAEQLDPLMDGVRGLECSLQRCALLVARWSGARSGEVRKLDLDCLDTYPDGTHRLRLAAGKSRAERVVPIHPEAADAIRALATTRREQNDRPLFDHDLGREVRFLFLRHGRLASADYLFTRGLTHVCQQLGFVDDQGKALIHPHRFRHTMGTQLGERGAKLQTIMKILGHRTAGMSMTYTSLSDPVVLADYQSVLAPGAVLAGPQAEAIRNGDLTTEAVNWLATNFFKTELELGRCLRLPQEGPCECDLYLTCSKFLTTPDYAPRLRARIEVEQQLIVDATDRSWAREVERHQRIADRIQALLDELGTT